MIFCDLRFSLRRPLLLALLVAGGSGRLTEAVAQPAPATVYTTRNSPLPADGVGALAYDGARATLWVGTENGLATLAPGAGSGSSVWAGWGALPAGPLPHPDVRALALDPATGSVWVGTFGGLARYNGRTWHRWTQATSGLPNDAVRALAPTPDGGTWVGTADGLAHVDSTGTRWQVFRPTNSPLLSANSAALRLAPDGTLWVGTINGGLARRAPGGGWQLYTLANAHLPDNTILALALDSLDRPVLGTAAAGLARYLTDSTWAVYGPRNSANPAATVQALTQDAAGRWWLGSAERGLVAWDRGRWQAFPYNSPLAGLPDSTVRAVVPGAGGELWIGLRSGGLAHWRPGALARVPAAEFQAATTGPGTAYVVPNPARAGQRVVVSRNGPPPKQDQLAACLTDARGATWLVAFTPSVSVSAPAETGSFVVPAVAPGLYVLRLNWRGGVLSCRLVVE